MNFIPEGVPIPQQPTIGRGKGTKEAGQNRSDAPAEEGNDLPQVQDYNPPQDLVQLRGDITHHAAAPAPLLADANLENSGDRVSISPQADPMELLAEIDGERLAADNAAGIRQGRPTNDDRPSAINVTVIGVSTPEERAHALINLPASEIGTHFANQLEEAAGTLGEGEAAGIPNQAQVTVTLSAETYRARPGVEARVRLYPSDVQLDQLTGADHAVARALGEIDMSPEEFQALQGRMGLQDGDTITLVLDYNAGQVEVNSSGRGHRPSTVNDRVRLFRFNYQSAQRSFGEPAPIDLNDPLYDTPVPGEPTF